MNYRHTAKKYRASKPIKLNDIVEIRGSHTGFYPITSGLRGRVVRVDRPLDRTPDPIIILTIPGYDTVEASIDAIRLISQPAVKSEKALLTDWLTKVGGNLSPTIFRAYGGVGDSSVIIGNVKSKEIVALIERRAVKVNKAYSEYEKTSQVFKLFAKRRNVPLSVLASPKFTLKGKHSNRGPFWRLDKREKSPEDLNTHNLKLLNANPHPGMLTGITGPGYGGLSSVQWT